MYEQGELLVWESYGRSEPVAQLPHSCDFWEIGGIEEIDLLIADLEAAKAEILEAKE